MTMLPDTTLRPRRAQRPSFEQSPPQRGRGECRAPAAPAAPCALGSGRTHTSSNEYAGITRHSRTRMVLTISSALSSVTGLSCHRHQRIGGLSAPGRADMPIRELDASVGASGPHGFFVRVLHVSSACSENRSRAHHPPCDPIARNMPPRPSHPAPNVRDDRETPLSMGRDGRSCKCDLGGAETGLFLRKGLDRKIGNTPDGQIKPVSLQADETSWAQLPLVAPHGRDARAVTAIAVTPGENPRRRVGNPQLRSVRQLALPREPDCNAPRRFNRCTSAGEEQPLNERGKRHGAPKLSVGIVCARLFRYAICASCPDLTGTFTSRAFRSSLQCRGTSTPISDPKGVPRSSRVQLRLAVPTTLLTHDAKRISAVRLQ
jgi:hypothetical protein